MKLWRRASESRPLPPPLPAEALPWLLAAALFTVAPHFLYQPGWLTALAGLVFAWRGWLVWKRLPLPPRWLLMLLVTAGVAAIALEYRTLFGGMRGWACWCSSRASS